MKAPKPAAWPAAGSAEVSLTPQPGARALGGLGAPVSGAGNQPVWIGARGGRVARAGVSALGEEVSRRAGVRGPLMRVARADGAAAAGRLSMLVDYSGF